MDGSQLNDLPTLLADTESLKRELEQRFRRLESTTLRQGDQTDTQREAAMVISGK